jgi:heme/copper-type cytochrome/quinol oxidase subunit 2
MQTKHLPLFLLVLLICHFVLAHATGTANLTLYGSSQGGWGFTANNITSPGPTIVVEQGDTVNLTLISSDGAKHLFFVSYTNDSTTIGAGDPQSAPFSGTVNYSFTATNTAGTYEYFCYYDSTYYNPELMWGYFRVVPTGTIPEFQPLAMLTLFILSIGIAALARKRRRVSIS